MSCSTNSTAFSWKSLTSMRKNRRYRNGLQTPLKICASKKTKHIKVWNKIRIKMKPQKNSNYYTTSFKKVLKKLKKIFMHKNSNHVLETQGKHISYSMILKEQLEKVHKSLRWIHAMHVALIQAALILLRNLAQSSPVLVRSWNLTLNMFL